MSEGNQKNPEKRGPFRRSFESQQLVQWLATVADHERVVTYEEMSRLVGQQVDGSYGPLQTAKNAMRSEYGRVYETIPGQGVRWVSSGEISKDSLSASLRRTRNANRRALKKAACVDPSELTPEELAEFNAKTSQLAVLDHFTSAKASQRIGTMARAAQAKLPVQETLDAFRQNGK